MSKPIIIFFGNERLATGVKTTAPTLQALIDAGYQVAAVVANNETTTSRKVRTLEIAEVAEQHGIPVLLPNKPAEIIDQLRSYNAAVGVLAAYGRIVPKSVIDIFPHGIINIHPSHLPKHRGPIPIESVILNGELETAVSVMRLVKAMDGGPVYGRAEVALSGDETKQELADELLEIGGHMIIELLPGILDESLVALPQNEDQATFDALITKEDGILDFNKPAAQLEREVRAFADWPKSRTTVGDKEVAIVKAHVTSGVGEPGTIWREAKEFGFYTIDGILVIDTLKPAGKGEMPAAAFLAGYKL